MTRVSSIFSQILQLIPRLEFESAARQHNSERHARGFTSWGHAVISTASSTISCQPGDSIETVDLQGQLELVKAAKANGINRFIFVSFRRDPLNPSPLSDAKQAVEHSLQDLQEALESQARASTGSLEKSFAALMLKLSRGDEIDMRPVHEKFPFQLTSVRDYARKVSG